MQTYHTAAEDVIIILDKSTLFSQNGEFYKHMCENKKVEKLSPNFSSAVLYGKDDNAVLKLLSSSPKNILKQLLNGNIYLK